MDLGAVAIILQLVFLEGVLSIDNAAVLGAMVAHLPNDRPIPWPRQFEFLSRWSARVLGPQRQAALKVGLIGAYVGRALMLLLAGLIIDVPWVRITGALYLLYLAIEHFGEMYRHESHAAHAVEGTPRQRGGFWSTVLGIELADLAFSVDNVIAAVALSNQLWVVMLGVAIGIVIMRFAAQIFTRLIAWEPAMASGAYLLLVAIAVQLLVDEFFHFHLEEVAQFLVSVGVLGLAIVFARVPFLRPLTIIFRPLMAVAAAVAWAVEGVKQIVTLPFRRRNLPHQNAGDPP